MNGARVGTLVAALIALLIGSGFCALFGAAGGASGLLSVGPYLTRVLGFSVLQAALSTLMSLALGTALALALARRRFRGRSLVMAALGAAAVMPAIVVVFAVTAVYGRGGWLVEGLRSVGLDAQFRIFGWPGILLAHVFLNAPFVARVCLDALATVPAEHWRLARTLNFSPGEVFSHVDWPALRSTLAGLGGLVFLLCFTSFAIVLTLGGGTGRATLEVAIFQALHADLDFSRAAWLGLVQIAVCAGFAALLSRLVSYAPAGQTIREPADRPDATNPRLRMLDALVLTIGALLIAPPLVSVATSIAYLPALLDRDTGEALLTSLSVGVASATVTCLLAVALAAAARTERLRGETGRAAAFDVIPVLVLAVPPFALTAGLFLIVRRMVEPALAGYVLLPIMNALGALPFAYRFIAPAVMTAGERYGRVADLLGLAGAARLRIVEWPLLRGPLAAAFAMAVALSFGDFGVVALFGGSALRTLPYLLYERLGAYRLDEAAALGLLLVAVAFALASLSSRWSDAAR